MPALIDVRLAGVQIAELGGSFWRDASPARFYGELVPLAVRRPQDWGFPPSYAHRPNWDSASVGAAIANGLWGKPFHPQAEAARRWHGLPYRVLRQLCAGVTPAQVLNAWANSLTPRECAELLDSAACNRRCGGAEWERWIRNPLTWLTRHCPIEDYVPRSRAVADWLVAKKLWAGWVRPLEIGYQDGAMGTIHPQNMLDEVQEDDLAQGPKSNPERVFRAVLARTSKDALMEIARRNLPFPAMPWTEIPGVRQIRCESELVAEGARMSHCVGGYSDRCRSGRCFILRLPGSTAEVLPNGATYQHKGFKNSDPSPADKSLLAKWVATRKREL